MLATDLSLHFTDALMVKVTRCIPDAFVVRHFLTWCHAELLTDGEIVALADAYADDPSDAQYIGWEALRRWVEIR